jgi:hypothetical protein
LKGVENEGRLASRTLCKGGAVTTDKNTLHAVKTLCNSQKRENSSAPNTATTPFPDEQKEKTENQSKKSQRGGVSLCCLGNAMTL